MDADGKRCYELADQIEAALNKDPAGSGTKIEILDGDWHMMIEALRTLPKTEALHRAFAVVAAKANLTDEEIVAVLKEAQATVAADKSGGAQLH
jgi:hypothetical protein